MLTNPLQKIPKHILVRGTLMWHDDRSGTKDDPMSFNRFSIHVECNIRGEQTASWCTICWPKSCTKGVNTKLISCIIFHKISENIKLLFSPNHLHRMRNFYTTEKKIKGTYLNNILHMHWTTVVLEKYSAHCPGSNNSGRHIFVLNWYITRWIGYPRCISNVQSLRWHTIYAKKSTIFSPPNPTI